MSAMTRAQLGLTFLTAAVLAMPVQVCVASPRVAVANTAELRAAMKSVGPSEQLIIALKPGRTYPLGPGSGAGYECFDKSTSIRDKIIIHSALPLIRGDITITGRGATLRGINSALLPFCVLEKGALTLRDTEVTAFGRDPLVANREVRAGWPSVLLNSGSTRLLNTVIHANGAPDTAFYTLRSFGGLHIENSVIADNTARIAGIESRGTLTVLNSSVVNNRLIKTRNGYPGAAGLTVAGEAFLRNVTVSGNQIQVPDNSNTDYTRYPRSAGISVYGSNGASVVIEHATIVNNRSETAVASGLGASRIRSGQPGVVVRNSIIANNEGGNCARSSSILFQGVNLFSDESCGDPPQALTNLEPRLAPLNPVNEGPPVHVPLPGSPVVEAADPQFCPPRDQLGNIRDVSGDNDGCALGAVEPLLDQLQINSRLNATWYDKSHDGHYVSTVILPDDRLFAIWWTYTPSGEQLWLYGVGVGNGNHATFKVYESRGMSLPALNPAARSNIPWGEITLKFENCQRLILSWQSTQPGFPDGRASLERLTNAGAASGCGD